MYRLIMKMWNKGHPVRGRAEETKSVKIQVREKRKSEIWKSCVCVFIFPSMESCRLAANPSLQLKHAHAKASADVRLYLNFENIMPCAQLSLAKLNKCVRCC